MPLDAVVIHAIREELQNELIGARIDKVQMPERDVLLLSVRGNAGNRKLLLSANINLYDEDGNLLDNRIEDLDDSGWTNF